MFPSQQGESFLDEWAHAVAVSELKHGDRDRVAEQPKGFVRDSLRKPIGQRILRRSRLRKLLGRAYPTISGNEWSLPSWYLRGDGLDEVLHVYKVLQNPYWMRALLESDYPVRIVHNVRRPEEYLASWHRRYLAVNRGEDVNALNKKILTAVSEQDGHWRGRWSDLQSMDVIHTEMLIWLYTNETIYIHGKGKANYMTTLYHEVDEDCALASRALYDFAGLEWDAAVGAAATRMENKLFAKKGPLDPAVAEAISRAVESTLAQSVLLEVVGNDTRLPAGI